MIFIILIMSKHKRKYKINHTLYIKHTLILGYENIAFIENYQNTFGSFWFITSNKLKY